MKNKRALVALVAAGALGLSACASSSSQGSGAAGSKEPIKVGLMVPIANTPTTPDIYTKPAAMAVDEINKAGGLGGRQLVLQQYDAGFTAEGAITAMQKAISDGVQLVVGLPVTDQVLAVRPLLDRAKIPLLYTGGGYAAAYDPGNTKGASEWSFRVGPPSELTVNAGVQYAIKNLGAKKIALLLRDDATKGTSEEQARKGAQAAGGEISVVRTIPLDSTDLTTQILAAKNSGAQAIFTTDYVPAIAAVLKGVKQQGLGIPTIVGQTGMTVYLQKVVPDLVSTMYSSAPCNMFDPYNDKAKQWVTDFQAKYHFMPDPNSSTTYDAYYLFKQAFEAAGSKTGEPLLKQLETLKADGVCVPYDVDKQHFMSNTEVVMAFSGTTPKTVGTFNFAQ